MRVRCQLGISTVCLNRYLWWTFPGIGPPFSGGCRYLRSHVPRYSPDGGLFRPTPTGLSSDKPTALAGALSSDILPREPPRGLLNPCSLRVTLSATACALASDALPVVGSPPPGSVGTPGSICTAVGLRYPRALFRAETTKKDCTTRTGAVSKALRPKPLRGVYCFTSGASAFLFSILTVRPAVVKGNFSNLVVGGPASTTYCGFPINNRPRSGGKGRRYVGTSRPLPQAERSHPRQKDARPYVVLASLFADGGYSRPQARSLSRPQAT